MGFDTFPTADNNKDASPSCPHPEHKGKGVGFTCPFHEKGERENTIMNVELIKNREQNIDTVRKAIENFYNTPESPALRFRLPQSLTDKCKTFEQLQTEIIPYQTDILAAELTLRLNPFLPYQHGGTKEGLAKVIDQNPRLAYVTHLLERRMKQLKFDPPKKPSDLSEYLQEYFEDAFAGGHYVKGKTSPTVMIEMKGTEGDDVPVLRISPGNVHIHPDIEGDVSRDSFSIVMSPLYPKEFGRWSDKTEIVFTRMKDFQDLGRKASLAIQKKSHEVLAAAGIDMENIMVHPGVWIPNYLDKKEG